MHFHHHSHNWNLTCVTPATEYPVSRDELIEFLKLDQSFAPSERISLGVQTSSNVNRIGQSIGVIGYDAACVCTFGTLGDDASVVLTFQDSADGVQFSTVSGMTATIDSDTPAGTVTLVYAGGKAYVKALASITGTNVTLGVNVLLNPLNTDENATLDGLIAAATNYAERYTRRVFITSEWKYSTDFPVLPVALPIPPVTAVSAVTYTDSAGQTQTLSPALYQVDLLSAPGRIDRTFGLCWPAMRRVLNGFQVTFTAGYGSAADVPEAIKLAIKQLCGHFYANREATLSGTIIAKVPFTIDAILSIYRYGNYR